MWPRILTKLLGNVCHASPVHCDLVFARFELQCKQDSEEVKASAGLNPSQSQSQRRVFVPGKANQTRGGSQCHVPGHEGPVTGTTAPICRSDLALSLLSSQELVEEHGKSPDAMAAEKYVQPTHFSRVVFSALYTMLDATACSAQNRQDHVHQRVAQGRGLIGRGVLFFLCLAGSGPGNCCC